jgi:hypothetical protein
LRGPGRLQAHERPLQGEKDLTSSEHPKPNLEGHWWSRSRDMCAIWPERLVLGAARRALMLQLKKDGLHGCPGWIHRPAENRGVPAAGRRAAGVRAGLVDRLAARRRGALQSGKCMLQAPLGPPSTPENFSEPRRRRSSRSREEVTIEHIPGARPVD